MNYMLPFNHRLLDTIFFKNLLEVTACCYCEEQLTSILQESNLIAHYLLPVTHYSFFGAQSRYPPFLRQFECFSKQSVEKCIENLWTIDRLWIKNFSIRFFFQKSTRSDAVFIIVGNCLFRSFGNAILSWWYIHWSRILTLHLKILILITDIMLN